MTAVDVDVATPVGIGATPKGTGGTADATATNAACPGVFYQGRSYASSRSRCVATHSARIGGL